MSEMDAAKTYPPRRGPVRNDMSQNKTRLRKLRKELTKETSERDCTLSESIGERDIFGRSKEVDENHNGGVGTSICKVTNCRQDDHSQDHPCVLPVDDNETS